jgi:hypothetical protein
MIDMNALKILESRHDFLLLHSPHLTNEKSFAFKELSALGEATDFIRWMLNNTSDETVRKTFEKYRQENAAKMDVAAAQQDSIAAHTAKNALLRRMLHIFHENSGRNCKIQVILSEDGGAHYIELERIHHIPETLLWRKVSYIKLSLYRLERIVKKAHAIIKIKAGEDPEKVPDAEFIRPFLSKYTPQIEKAPGIESRSGGAWPTGN